MKIRIRITRKSSKPITGATLVVPVTGAELLSTPWKLISADGVYQREYRGRTIRKRWNCDTQTWSMWEVK